MPTEACEVTTRCVMHHVGVAVACLEAAIQCYSNVFGYRVLSGPFSDPLQQVSVCFVGSGILGEPSVELVAPAGEKSPIAAILRKGIGIYHICYEVADLDGVLAYVRSKGCILLGNPVPAVAFEGRRIAWFYTPTRQLFECVESAPAANEEGQK